MSLKDDMVSDLNLFFNDEEFAQEATANGAIFLVIEDFDGGYQDSYVDTVITCKTQDAINLNNGDEVITNGITYKVHLKSPDKNGVTEVALVKN